jgi:hypothetical protein
LLLEPFNVDLQNIDPLVGEDMIEPSRIEPCTYLRLPGQYVRSPPPI